MATLPESDCFPASLEAERAILGAILVDGASYAEAQLKADDFSLDSHRRIFRVIEGMAASEQSIDLVTVVDALRQSRELQSVGDADFVAALIDGVPDRPHIRSYARMVREKSILRRLIYAANAAVARAQDGESSHEIAAGLLESILDVEAQRQKESSITLRALMPETLQEIQVECQAGTLVGLPSGLNALDEMTGGFRRGELIVLGGQPGRGKTAFACQILAANAEAGTPVGVFSVEMSRTDIGRRLLASVGPVSAMQIRNPLLIRRDEWSRLAEAAAEISKWPVHLDDSGSLSVTDMVARAKLLIARIGIKLLIVDHLQLVQAESRDVRERVSKVAEACRQIAKAEQIVVVLLSQLRRPQSADDKPTMLDLKESGDIEAAAHAVLLLHTPDGQPEQEEIIVGKNRNGPKGPIPVVFNRKNLRFYSRA